MTEPSTMMKALMLTDFNRLELQSVPVPHLNHPLDVLVRVRAAAICGSDLHGYTGRTGRRHPPLIMGHEVAGEVAAVGAGVRRVRPGDRVALHPLIYRADPATGRTVRQMIGMNLPGAYAEYTVVPETNVYPIPDTLPFSTAALTEPLAVAVHAVGIAHVQPYDRALVIGAGTIGLLTMQVLLLAGVREVTVSDISETRLDIARQMGAAHVINPTAHDFATVISELTGGEGFDLVYEAVGIGATVGQSLQAIRDGGTVVWIGNSVRFVEVDMQAVVTRELRIAGSYGMNERDFRRALAMLADGRVAAETIISRRAVLDEGPTLFDELLRDEAVVKCVFELP